MEKSENWSLSLEVNKREEVWYGSLITEYKIEDNGRFYIKEAIESNPEFEIKKHGFLILDFLKSEKDWYKNPKKFLNWKARYGITDNNLVLGEAAQYFKLHLGLINGESENKQAWLDDIANKIQDINIIGSRNGIFTVTSTSIISLMAYEIIELYKFGKSIGICACGEWFIRNNSKGHQLKHCPNCPSPSKRKGYDRNGNNERVKKCRVRKELESGKITYEEVAKKEGKSIQELKAWIGRAKHGPKIKSAPQ
jgi:hypothetical protein